MVTITTPLVREEPKEQKYITHSNTLRPQVALRCTCLTKRPLTIVKCGIFVTEGVTSDASSRDLLHDRAEPNCIVGGF